MLSKNTSSKRSTLGLVTRLIAVLLLIVPFFIIFSPDSFRHFNLGTTSIALDKINITGKIAIAFVSALHQLILVTGLFAMAKVFDLLKGKRWFLPDLSYQLRTFGISLIVFVITAPVMQALLVIILTLDIFYHMPSYKVEDKIFTFSITTDGLLVLLVGVLLVFLAKVLAKATQNARELEEIV